MHALVGPRHLAAMMLCRPLKFFAGDRLTRSRWGQNTSQQILTKSNKLETVTLTGAYRETTKIRNSAGGSRGICDLTIGETNNQKRHTQEPPVCCTERTKSRFLTWRATEMRCSSASAGEDGEINRETSAAALGSALSCQRRKGMPFSAGLLLCSRHSPTYEKSRDVKSSKCLSSAWCCHGLRRRHWAESSKLLDRFVHGNPPFPTHGSLRKRGASPITAANLHKLILLHALKASYADSTPCLAN